MSVILGQLFYHLASQCKNNINNFVVLCTTEWYSFNDIVFTPLYIFLSGDSIFFGSTFKCQVIFRDKAEVTRRFLSKTENPIINIYATTEDLSRFSCDVTFFNREEFLAHLIDGHSNFH